MVDGATSAAELIAQATIAFRDSAIADPRREATRLWVDLVHDGSPRALVATAIPVSDTDSARFLAAVEQRIAGAPLAYVTGWTGFRHLTLACDARALIPRPETEGLVELALARVRTGVAADIGTGTGAVALSLRHEGAFERVIGTDLSPDALELAQVNAVRTGNTVDWRLGDLVEPLQGELVDLLVSNPPYLTDAEYAELDSAVRDYEPQLALPSGVDGMTAIRRLLTDAPLLMAAGGWVALEIDSRRADIAARLAREAGWQDVTIHDDLFGRARYLLARHGDAHD